MAANPFNYSGATYRAARAQAFARSDGVCQFCGQAPAVEAHHWRTVYKPEPQTTPDELTALCGLCHEIATTLRRFRGDKFGFIKTFKETVEQCYSGSESRGKPQSYITPRAGLTRPASSALKSPPSPPSAAPTERRLTMRG